MLVCHVGTHCSNLARAQLKVRSSQCVAKLCWLCVLFGQAVWAFSCTTRTWEWPISTSLKWPTNVKQWQPPPPTRDCPFIDKFPRTMEWLATFQSGFIHLQSQARGGRCLEVGNWAKSAEQKVQTRTNTHTHSHTPVSVHLNWVKTRIQGTAVVCTGAAADVDRNSTQATFLCPPSTVSLRQTHSRLVGHMDQRWSWRWSEHTHTPVQQSCCTLTQ